MRATFSIAHNGTAAFWYRYQYMGSAIYDVRFAWTDSADSSTGEMLVTLWPPSLMGSGTYEDLIMVEFCRDSQCNDVFAGQTKTIPVSYEVTGSTPSIVTFNVTPAAGLVVEATNADSTATTQIQVSTVELPPYTTYLRARIEGTGAVTNGNWVQDPLFGGYKSDLLLELASPAAIGPGRHAETVTLSICYDLECNRPARGSPWSIPIRYTVTATSPLDYAERTANVRANDLMWSPSRGMLYAVTAPNSVQHPSSLVEIDPATAEVIRAVSVGGNPKVLALSDDGLHAYVGFSDLGEVRRVDLPALQPDLTIALPVDPVHGTTFAGYLLPVPGAAGSVAISLYISAFGLTDWASRGVYIYDDAVPRSEPFLPPDAGTRAMGLAWSADGTQLYAYDSNQKRLFTATASASGLTLVDTKPNVNMWPAMSQLDGRLYSNGGMVVDPQTGNRTATFLGSEVVSLALAAPDSTTGRAYFYYMEELTPVSKWTFATYDLQTQDFIASTRVSGCSLFPGGVNTNIGRLVRWGTDGLAVNCSEGIRIINGRFVAP